MRRATIIRLLRRLLRNRSGATAIEYAIIAAGIAAVLVGAIATLGGSVTAMWTSIQAAFH
jgi:pilus assembly protein Flp/PilA